MGVDQVGGAALVRLDVSAAADSLHRAVCRTVHVQQVVDLVTGHFVELEESGEIAMANLGAALLDVADRGGRAAQLLRGGVTGDLRVGAHAFERRAELDAVGGTALPSSHRFKLDDTGGLEYEGLGDIVELCFGGQRGNFQIQAKKGAQEELVTKGAEALREMQASETDD